MRISIAEANFSHNLGTLPKMVGETSRRFWGNVSGLSTKLTVYPVQMAWKREIRFS